ncbi:MAG: AMP-binding protein [Candidatus Cloacimonadales bacterium]|jgi:long-chain acyl-CoA synthetase|nr:AMP-binding protein [Candidatus Cloacimonadota bacterium]MDX9976538.1 AMP-binding protein [Candidatus Cloacimonadales bacterium]
MIKENFVEYFEEKIKSFWELPALSNCGKESISYKDLAYAIMTMHELYDKLKIKKGEKIALIGKNSLNWAVVYLSTVTYGATIVPIMSNFSYDDLHHIMNHSESRLVFAADKFADEIDMDRLKETEYLLLLNDFSLLSSKKNIDLDDCINRLNNLKNNNLSKDEFVLSKKISNNQLAALLYTSGTTGFSKGVMLDYNSLMANVLVASRKLLFKTGANMVSFLPLSHAYACSFDFLYPLTCGNHIHFLDKMPTPKVLVDAFKKYKPNIILSVPLIIEKIYKRMISPELQKPAVKLLLKIPITRKLVYNKIKNTLLEAFGGNLDELVIGGAAMNAEVETFLRDIGFPFTVGYGMTECGPLISYENWHKTRLFSSGHVVEYLELKIDSPNPYDIVGEIMVKGEQVMLGYYKNREASDEVLVGDGWLRTGDLGVIDKDMFVYIRGRSKNVLVGSSGENIYPEELEQKINNLKYVMESLVLEKNDSLMALIYPDFEEIDKEQIKEVKINELIQKNKEILNEQLPAHSKIREFKIVSEPFQKTPTQKIKRYLYVN